MSTNVPNLKQIGGGHRKNGQKFVDLMWNDPYSFQPYVERYDTECSFTDLVRDQYTFGRGETCDYQFNTAAMKRHPCFQAYSKLHFTLVQVRLYNTEGEKR